MNEMERFIGCKSKPGIARVRLLPVFILREWRHFKGRYRLSLWSALIAVKRACVQFVKAPADDCWWCGGTGRKRR